MNTVLWARPALRSRAPGQLAAWIARHLDVPLRTSSTREVLALECDQGLLAAAADDVAAELVVTRLASALRACERGGARWLSGSDEEALVETPTGDRLVLREEPPGRAREGAVSARAEEDAAGPVRFTVSRTLDADPDRLFASLTSARELERTHVTRASADLTETGEPVRWWWTEQAASRLEVVAVDPPPGPPVGVTFLWHAHHVDHRTRVRFEIVADGTGCRVAITESGWRDDARGRNSAFAHAESWTELLINTDLYLRHGLELVHLARRT